MTKSDAELDQLFDEMASIAEPAESPAHEARRRQRAIGGMRAMHRSLAEERAQPPRRRRYQVWLAAAAALVLCGSALAALSGRLRLSFDNQQVTQPQPAAGTKPAAPAAPPSNVIAAPIAPPPAQPPAVEPP